MKSKILFEEIEQRRQFIQQQDQLLIDEINNNCCLNQLEFKKEQLINEKCESERKYEDMLVKEIERILMDIYTSNLKAMRNNTSNDDNHNNTCEYLKKFEKQMQFHASRGKEFNIMVLRILATKICTMVTQIKDKIYEVPEFRCLKEKFTEIKQTFEANKKRLLQENYHYKRSEFDWNNLSLNIVNSLPIFLQKQSNGEQEYNINKITTSLLIELKRVFGSLIHSARHIEFIFESNLRYLAESRQNNFRKLNFEEIHKEEFSAAVTNDEFLRAITLQFGQKNNKNLDELNMLLTHGVDDIVDDEYKERNRFLSYIEEELSYLSEGLSESSYEDEFVSKLEKKVVENAENQETIKSK
jgi:hypothetical protein